MDWPTQRENPKVSIVVPAHNEEGNLEDLIHTLVQVLEKEEATQNYEILLVNDNSTDKTGELIQKYAQQNPRIRDLHRYKDPGFGQAVKAGLSAARGDIIIPVMADLSENPEDILALVKALDHHPRCHIAYGSRFCKGGKVEDYPPLKLFFNRLGNFAIRLLFGLPRRDVTNAFKAYRREVIQEIGVENLESKAFDLTIEIPLKAHILGFSSMEVPVSWKNRTQGEAKLKLSKHCQKYGYRLISMLIKGNLIALKDLTRSLMEGARWKAALSLVIGFLLLYAVFLGIGKIEPFHYLEKVHPMWFALALLSLFLSFAFRTWRWSVLFRGAGSRTSRTTLFKAILLGHFFNYLFPFRIGDLARAVSLKTAANKPLGVVFLTLFIERMLDLFFLATGLVLAMYLLPYPLTMIPTLIFTGVGAFFILLFLVLLGSKIEVYKLEKSSIMKNIWKKDLLSFGEGALELFQNPFALLLAFMITCCIWSAEIFALFFSAQSLDLDISASLAFISGISAFISQALPNTPGGLGVHEWAISSVCAVFGYAKTSGLTLGLVDHIARALVIYPFGALATSHLAFQSRSFFREEKSKEDHQEEKSSQEDSLPKSLSPSILPSQKKEFP